MEIEGTVDGFVVIDGELCAVGGGGGDGALIGPGELAGFEIGKEVVFPGPALLLHLLGLGVEAAADGGDLFIEGG